MTDCDWPSLTLAPLSTYALPWPKNNDSTALFDQQISHFIGQFEHCQWLSSCYPHFQQEQHCKDVIAGGFTQWLTNKNGLCQLSSAQSSDNNLKLTADALPVSWMLEQLEQQQLNNNSTLDPWIKPGWFGGLSYTYHPQSVGIAQQLNNNSEWPDAIFGFARWVITLDFSSTTATLLTVLPANSPALKHLRSQWRKATTQQPPAPQKLKLKPWQALTSKKQYEQSFAHIQEAIAAGDTYQVNYTQCFTAPFIGSPMTGFLHLKQQSPSPYTAYWATPYGIVSSHSPELFIRIDAPFRATTKPIKGTSPRGKTATQDTALLHQLQNCEKNQAENTMIVDLLRNDLSKTAIPGTMRVASLCAVESYSAIHHLVSEISCDIKAKYHGMDVITSSFPGGSITGAPKRRAMEIIDQLEQAPRDIYCGSIGFWDHPRRALFNIAIRTLLFQPALGIVKIWAGGGIVKDSQQTAEYAECFHKVHHLMVALTNNLDHAEYDNITD